MKKILLFLLGICLMTKLFAQAPQGIPYQSAMRNSSGGILANQSVSIRFSIHDSAITGAIVYQETHASTTSSQGIVSLTIGQGTAVTGTFTGINWGHNSKFLQVEMNVTGGSSYVDLGTQQMMSVPYALFAETVRNIPVTKYSIGLHPDLGGYVFALSADSTHGLVCEIQDQGINVSLYESHDIISNPANHSPYGAAFHDWRIPSKYELSILYLNHNAIGGFSISDYWSASEYGTSNAWLQFFSNGSQYNSSKNNPAYVRAVRSF